ncbi:hypothetical protein GCQ56_07645 [Marinifilum sp. N1E240]|uniref:hypothetical protein n=1 Tax=Marinifilum sp. N1E240 TaxID=2608082 RepID=UPI00128C4E12|nr:hypothetical protein [Marinifilum sp. N1E240]MPQ46886.1 hypothetical protein [Marinifilum sp. N1E240]
MDKTVLRKGNIFILLLLLLIGGILSLYFMIFHGSLSLDSSDWSNFAGFFGGIVGTLATVSTLIWIVLSFKNQIQVNEKNEKIKSLETQMFKVGEELKEIKNHNITPLELLPFWNLVQDKRKRKKYFVENDKVYGEISDGQKVLIRDIDLFSVINISIKELGLDQTKQIFMNKDEYNVISSLHSFKSHLIILLIVVRELLILDYDRGSLNYYLASFNYQMVLLKKLGIFSEEDYKRYLILQSYPVEQNVKLPCLREDIVYLLKQSHRDFSGVKKKDVEISESKFSDSEHSVYYDVKIRKLNIELKLQNSILMDFKSLDFEE